MRKRTRWLCLLLSLLLLLTACGGVKEAPPQRAGYDYVFVHGLSGWGSYDKAYKVVPYWGMLSGNLLKYLEQQGFFCYAASVAQEGSAWDRACELYAQFTGGVVDYGKEHSALRT